MSASDSVSAPRWLGGSVSDPVLTWWLVGSVSDPVLSPVVAWRVRE